MKSPHRALLPASTSGACVLCSKGDHLVFEARKLILRAKAEGIDSTDRRICAEQAATMLVQVSSTPCNQPPRQSPPMGYRLIERASFVFDHLGGLRRRRTGVARLMWMAWMGGWTATTVVSTMTGSPWRSSSWRPTTRR